MPIVSKSRNLNLLEPSGPVQACNGIVLPFGIVIDLSVLEIVSGRTQIRTSTSKHGIRTRFDILRLVMLSIQACGMLTPYQLVWTGLIRVNVSKKNS